MTQFGCRFVMAAAGIRVASYGHVEEGHCPWRLTGFWFQADPAFVCVSSDWADRSSLFLVGISTLVWPTAGRQWGTSRVGMRANKRNVSRAWARLRSVSGAASVKRLPRVQIQANMLGLRIQSCEVFLILVRWSVLGLLQTEAIEEKLKVTETRRELRGHHGCLTPVASKFLMLFVIPVDSVCEKEEVMKE